MPSPALLASVASLFWALRAAAQRTSFGSAAKDILINSGETELLAYNVTNGAACAHISLITIESAELLWQAYDAARLRVYLDGEPTASVTFPLGFADEGDLVPFGTQLIGNTAYNGGIYLTLKVPFTASVRVTLGLGAGDLGPHRVHAAIRGSTGLCPLTFAGAGPQPPATRTVLRVTAIDGATLAPGAVVPLVQSARPGVLAFIGFKPSSAANMSWSAGAFAAKLDGAPPFPLSFDTENFFLTADGYSSKTYTTPLAGITALDALLAHRIIAWRAFDQDPVLWSASANITWTVGAQTDPAGETLLSAYVFFYEFE
jgi:hypothetical protein